MNETVAFIKGVVKNFKGMEKPALNHISAEIKAGHITGLVGPDGAGKTTLIRHMVGLMHPDDGEILINGLNTKTHAEEIHLISGYMPQRFGLYEDLSVLENLNLYADLRNVVGQERTHKFAELLRFTNLQPFQERLAGNLSGGMKQKLGLACALLGQPQILLLDEPSVGVDPISRRELWKMVKDLASNNIAVVWSTSYLDEAEKCDSVILLNEGDKLFDGPPTDLLDRVKGRTWQIHGIPEGNRRSVLMGLLKKDHIIDGVIQGQYVRIVTKDPINKPDIPEGKWVKVKPWFEDGFIDILGGAPMGESPLASEMKPRPGNTKAIIDAQNLTKKFGDFTAVRQSSFQIKRGEIFGLLGPNGAGKSTTFKMLCGLLQPTEGKALVNGLDLKTATSKARARIGYMAQKFSLYGSLNVLQNLRFFSGVYGLSGKHQEHQIDLMISLFALEPHLQMNAKELPLGFKQRLALACAVMHQPDVLFLDEPTSGVDPLTRREFWMHINGLVEKGVTIMVTTHFMDEAEYCDRISLIYKGESIATGSPDQLKELTISPKHPNPTLEDAFISLIEKRDQAIKEGS